MRCFICRLGFSINKKINKIRIQSRRRMRRPHYLFVCSVSLSSCHVRSFCLISEWNFKFPSMVDVGRTAFQHGRCVVSAISRARLCRAIATLAIVMVSAGPALAQAPSLQLAFGIASLDQVRHQFRQIHGNRVANNKCRNRNQGGESSRGRLHS